MLTPIDIHNKEFKRSFRGYNEDEIDDFLAQVVNDYEKLFRDNERLKAEVQQQKENLAQYEKLEKNLKDTHLVAQQTAEEVTANARDNAAKLRENTAKECQNMRREAELNADKITQETNAKLERKLTNAKTQLAGIVAEYDRLVQEKTKFLERMKVTFETELASVNSSLGSMPNLEAEKKSESKTVEGGEKTDADSAAHQEG